MTGRVIASSCPSTVAQSLCYCTRMTNNPDTQTVTIRGIRPGMVLLIGGAHKTVAKSTEIKSKYGIKKIAVVFTDRSESTLSGSSYELVGRADLYRVTYTTPSGRRTETMTNAERIAKDQQRHNGIKVTSARLIVSA